MLQVDEDIPQSDPKALNRFMRKISPSTRSKTAVHYSMAYRYHPSAPVKRQDFFSPEATSLLKALSLCKSCASRNNKSRQVQDRNPLLQLWLSTDNAEKKNCLGLTPSRLKPESFNAYVNCSVLSQTPKFKPKSSSMVICKCSVCN